ncbi:MAG: OmpA family protein [Bacteroidota bacterium]
MRKSVVIFLVLCCCAIGSSAQSSLPQAERLGSGVNSTYDELRPVIAPNGETLLFARKNHPQNVGDADLEDIWVSYLTDGQWSTAIKLVQPINNRGGNYPVALQPDGQQLYFYGDQPRMGENKLTMARKRGRSWSRPEALLIEDFQSFSTISHYHLSVDGQLLLLSATSDTGLGQNDLYISFRESGRWSRPMNLGPAINSPGDERSVFLAADGQTLYYSSDGHGGYGGQDMLISRRLDESWTSWSPPENLGLSINSARDEAYFSLPAAGDVAYFSASDAQGQTDLYRIRLPEAMQPRPVVLLSGRIIDGETQRPMSAQLRMQRLGAADAQETASDQEEAFHMVLPYGADISLYAEREGYFSVSESMELSDQGLEELDGDQQGLLAQIDGQLDYSSRSLEVERLQMRLTKLNQEMQELDKIRRAEAYKLSNRQRRGRQSDPELDALRHRYNEMLRQEEEVDQVRSNSTPTGTKSVETPSEDQELLELRRRFQKHYGGENTVKTAPPNSSSNEEALDQFDKVEDQIRLQLKKELFLDVATDLQKEHFTQLAAEYQRNTQNRINRAMRNEIWDRLRQNAENMLPKAEETNSTADAPKLGFIEKSLRPLLKDQVEEELRQELSAIIRKNVRYELDYQLKKEAEAALQKELANKIKKQQRQEKRLVTNNSDVTNSSSTDFYTPFYQEMKKDILLLPVKPGQIIPMNNIFFTANTPELKASSDKELERVLQFLQTHPEITIEFGAHTNGSLSQDFALDLSTKRAKAVADYFLSQGIDATRIQYLGYGKSMPIATNDTVKGRKKNQRIEMKILQTH